MQTATNPSAQIEAQILAKGLKIFGDMEADSGSIFNKDWWYGRIMDWSMKNEQFKTQMFRFVDVLPYLSSSAEVTRHLKEYFSEGGDELPSVFNFGLGLGALAPGLLAGTVKKNVEQMAKMFITGESAQAALPVLKKGRKNNLCFTADLLGEATLSESEALDYQNRYLTLIKDLSEDARGWDNNPLTDQDETGAIPKVNVSVKVTSLYSQVDPAAFQESLDFCKQRLRPILYAAKDRGVFINLDMEQYKYKNFTLQLFRDLSSEPDFKTWRHFGVVIQAYLRDATEDIKSLCQFAKARGTPFTIRLVKGAYWDYETIHARQNNWPVPVFTNKRESDASFERCAEIALDHFPYIRLALGSHNVRSIAAGLVAAEKRGLPQSAIEVQMLYGMAEPIKRALVKQGYRLREYATIGELIPGMAYLVRRLLENTSNESFLKSKFADNIAPEKLLANPADGLVTTPAESPKVDQFRNSPMLDFARLENRTALGDAIRRVSTELGKPVYPVIEKQTIKSTETFARYNPARPSQLISETHLASVKDADLAVNTARRAFASWSNTAPEKRIACIEKLANLIEEDRHTLTAIEVFEVGKTWREADGDITEAIDFCRYYARDMKRYSNPLKVGNAPGEASHYIYHAKGVALVIAPWNFPLAILTGMVSAALVTGNTVIMKPAEQSSLIASHLHRLLLKAGVPADVVSFLPGLGEIVGEHLVNHANIDLIAFTGSKSVGMNILKKAVQLQPGQKHVKRCIIEMGGKNAVIVDTDADLDEAVQGIVYSAFGFSGQKCSACSRVIVLDSIYDRFLERLIEATKSIKTGSPESPASYLGPVVDEESYQRILKTIEKAKTGARLAYQGLMQDEGYFIPPTIFADVDPQSELAQEEIFGPVLAVIRAQNLEKAIEIANDTPYALTGGFFSRSPANIAKVKSEFEVGNMYINRGNTGAMVERHPFGGFKLSGVGFKTGGPDYLLQFMEPRVVTENTMRRGFAPQE